MVGNFRRKHTRQCRNQSPLLGMQRRPVVDGTGSRLSHAPLSHGQASLEVWWQRAQGRTRHEGLFREAASSSGRARGRQRFNTSHPDDVADKLATFGRGGTGWFWWSRRRGFGPEVPAVGPFPAIHSAYRDALHANKQFSILRNAKQRAFGT